MTVSDVIKRLRRQVPELDDATIRDYIQEVHNDLGYHLPLKRVEEDHNLVALQEQYVLNSLTERVWSVELINSATDSRALLAIDYENLIESQPNFRRMPAGTPRRYYVSRDDDSERVIGVLPVPISATSGGYPILRVRTSRTSPITNATVLPMGVSADVYVYGSLSRWNPVDLAMRAMYEKQVQMEATKEGFANVQAPPSVRPAIPYRSGRV